MSKTVVICVDDERIIFESLKIELKNRIDPNLVIHISNSGEDALNLIEELMVENNEIVMIISDQKMPGIKGDQLLVKAHEITPSTLNILLTGFTDIETVKNAVNNAGFFKYLTKPWCTNDLVKAVSDGYKRFLDEKLINEQRVKIEKISLTMISSLENINYYNDDDGTTQSYYERYKLFDLACKKMRNG